MWEHLRCDNIFLHKVGHMAKTKFSEGMEAQKEHGEKKIIVKT